jgi:superoxide dismutase, Fe-Mn family
VTGANSTLEKLAEARDKGDFGAIVGLEKTLAFKLSGHVPHSIFWTNLSPDGGDKLDGNLARVIDQHFGARLLPPVQEREGRFHRRPMEHRQLV